MTAGTVAAPEVMYDEDGAPIGVRHDLARSPADALRRLLEEEGLWEMIENLYRYDSDEGIVPTLSLSALLAFIRGIVPGWMRPAASPDEHTITFGPETWVWCEPSEPAAVQYWKVTG